MIRRQERGGTAAALAAANEIPLQREFVVEHDSGRVKLGDGIRHYNDLPYVGSVAFLGTGQLLGGTATISDSFATTTTKIGVFRTSLGSGGVGHIYALPVAVDGTIEVRSDDPTDSGNFFYMIVG
jgi:hypothetical protein